MNAIRVALESVQHHINEMIQEAIARANERVAAAA
jgi:hypothetical protein